MTACHGWICLQPHQSRCFLCLNYLRVLVYHMTEVNLLEHGGINFIIQLTLQIVDIISALKHIIYNLSI